MKTEILKQLYEEYYDDAFLYVFSLCKNKEIAEDIVGEAFVKAYLSADKEIVNYKYWLLFICKNVWLDTLKKEKWKDHRELEKLTITSGQSIEDIFITKEKFQALYDAILRLKPEWQEILILHYFERIPLKEISEITQKSLSNVKVIIHRAKMILKKDLEENNYGV